MPIPFILSQWHIAPTGLQLHFRFLDGLNDFLTDQLGATDVCPKKSGVGRGDIPKREFYGIANIANQLFAAGWVHDHPRHTPIMRRFKSTAHKKGR
jgi:hypothetical protein